MFDTNRITNSKMADKMAAVQGKVTAFLGLTKESLDEASDSLHGDKEIKRRLIGRQNMMTRLSWTASARQLLLQGYGCISSVYISSAIGYCISPYANFYVGLSCFQNLWSKLVHNLHSCNLCFMCSLKIYILYLP